jgi:IclR family transcriptional regulator, pca regulon regulatory protein
MPAPATAAAIERRDLVDGLGKGLRVIEAFDDDHPQLTASDAAARAGITRTAARRYLLSLVHFGYAATDGKQFWLAPRVLRLGQSYLGAARLPRLVQPFIQRASMQCGHTVNASVLDEHEVVYIARSSPPRWLTIGYAVGVRVPAHVVTPGVVILATYNDEALDTWIAAHEFTAFTAHTVIDPMRFRADVQRARALDYSQTEQQLDPGLQGVAVALVDRKGRCRGAVSTTVPMSAYRSSADVRDAVLPLLRDVAQSLRPLL